MSPTLRKNKGLRGCYGVPDITVGYAVVDLQITDPLSVMPLLLLNLNVCQTDV